MAWIRDFTNSVWTCFEESWGSTLLAHEGSVSFFQDGVLFFKWQDLVCYWLYHLVSETKFFTWIMIPEILGIWVSLTRIRILRNLFIGFDCVIVSITMSALVLSVKPTKSLIEGVELIQVSIMQGLQWIGLWSMFFVHCRGLLLAILLFWCWSSIYQMGWVLSFAGSVGGVDR